MREDERLDFASLLQHFQSVQETHRVYKHNKIKQRLQSSIEDHLSPNTAAASKAKEPPPTPLN